MQRVCGVVDLELGSAADADFAHLARYQCGVRGNPAPCGQNPFGGEHAPDVFRAGFDAYEKNLFPFLGGRFGLVCREIDFSGSRTWAGRKATGDDLRCFSRIGVKHGGEELAEGIGRNAADGIVGLDQFFLHHFHGDADGGETGAFSVPGLQHEKASLFNGELKILHVMKVAFERMADILQLPIHLGHFDFELEDGFGSTDSGHHIFPLCIQEEFTVKDLFSSGRIPGERDS